MSQIVTINGTVNDLDVAPSLKVGSPPLWRPPEILNSRMVHGVTINGYNYPPAPSGSVLYLPGLPGYGDTIWDRTGNGNHGTITGATWTRTAGGLPLLSFDGANDLVTVTDAPSIQNIFDGGGTIIAYVNPASIGEGNSGVICYKIVGNSGYFFHVLNETANVYQIRFWYNFSDTDGRWRSTGTEVSEDQVSQVAVTYNADNVANDPIIYVNGISVALTEDSTPVGTRGSDVGIDLIIGNDSGGTLTWDGLIGLFIASTRIWTAQQLRDHLRQHRGLFGV